MKILKLEEGQTMAQVKAARKLRDDCAMVADVVNAKPGIPGKNAIADETGLTPARVSRCVSFINENETPFSRIDYGTRKAKDGPFAGQTVTGWFPMRYAAYQQVLDQADEHSSSVVRGVWFSKLTRLAFARGLTTKEARAAVASIETRLGVQLEQLTETELEAFQELFVEELENA